MESLEKNDERALRYFTQAASRRNLRTDVSSRAPGQAALTISSATAQEAERNKGNILPGGAPLADGWGRASSARQEITGEGEN
ncbi:hypothetical protein RRG08_012198 [Elysia crispata]|uniref:Uncharacterized protein n=1 Tax=Elysia crispata TaxID=231223 RepID=A0AAE1AJI4_9GAST|nr:hypothetical protein RRG08_012198 [Elysia crispata]